jgi:O-methyltransferase involved in polyketide biosynthesis
MMGVRTRFFDDFFIAAADVGIRQAVSSSSRPRRWPSWAPPRSAEGLLPFLPPDAQDRLLDNITALSAAGSQLATENLKGASDGVQKMAGRMRQVTDQWREHGFHIEMTDLWYVGDRNDAVEYLSTHGWATAATSVPDLCAAYGLSLPPAANDNGETLTSLDYVTAKRT